MNDMSNIEIYRDERFVEELKEQLVQRPHQSNWELFQLQYHYKQSTIITDFHQLQALHYLPQVDFLSYQLEAAKTVIEEMNGRAILADEVGLGKTIEAGLILKEYIVRGLVKNALILVPASLVNQWIIEFRDKFNISL